MTTPVPFSLAGILRHYAAARPHEPVFTCGDHTVSWAEHHSRSNQVAQALAASGIGEGDRVGLLDKNGVEYFEILFGGAKLRAVNVAVNWRLAPGEIAQIINDAGAKIVFVGPEFFGALAEVADQLGSVTTVVALNHPAGRRSGLEPAPAGWLDYAEWLSSHPDTDPGAAAEPEDVAMQLYTSGTTGLPKGVMLTNTNLGALVPEGSAELNIGPDSVSMVAMPLFHIGGSGWSLLGLANGCHSVIIGDVDPGVILRAIAEHGVTHTFVVPAVLMAMLAHPQCSSTDFSSLEIIAYGASPITEKTLIASVDTFRCGFAQLYGMTETTGAITLLRPEEHDPYGPHPERLRSCGVAFPHVAMRVVDTATGEDVAAGEVGEIWTSSPQNMAGYWANPVATAETIGPGGWLRTGDAGYFDGDGFLYLHDRVKDMIVSGGENVYPAEVENVLMSHPSVADVAVIGVPDDKWGETPKAIIVPAMAGRTPSESDARAIIDYCRERLAHYKCPTSIEWANELPRNPSGKILKRQLRAPYWADYDRQVN